MEPKDKDPDPNKKPVEPGKPDPVKPEDDPNKKKGIETLDETTQAYIKELREENKKHREANQKLSDDFTSFKEKLVAGISGKDTTKKPEEVIQELAEQNMAYAERMEAMESEKQIVKIANEYGLKTEKQIDYFLYKLERATENLKENEELPEGVLDEMIKDALAIGGGKPANSSTKGGADTTPQDDPEDTTSFEDFLKMNIMAKATYRERNPNQYNAYFIKARQEKKF